MSKPETTTVWLYRLIALLMVPVIGSAIFFGVPMAKFAWDYALMFWFKVPL